MVEQLKASMLEYVAPFMRWLPELADRAVLRADILAGITVALVLIPQSMAYAALAGLPAYYGLYAAFLPPIVAALFGSSRQLATGPVAVVSLLTAAALEPLATSGGEAYIAYAVLLAFMVGLFQLALGVLRLGVLVNFLSHPVVMGFTNAAAIIIATSQLPKIFGVTVEKAEHHYETVWTTLVTASTETYFPTLLMAIFAFTIMYGLKRYYPRLPGVLIAVGITTVLSYAMGYQKEQTVGFDSVADNALRGAIRKHQVLQANIGVLEKSLVEHPEDSQEYEGIEKGLNEAIKLERNHLQQLQQYKLIWSDGEGVVKGALSLEGNLDAPRQSDGRHWQFVGFNAEGELNLRAGGRVVGSIPEGLPSIHLPQFDWALILQLMGAAVTIALIGFMEAISIAKAMATRTRQRLDTDQELVGQGLSNIVGSLFQSYPVSGSFSRSAVNIGAGAVTGFSSVITGLVVLVSLLWLTPLLYHLPQATLAAVIMMAVFGLVNIKHFRHTWAVYRTDGMIAAVTFILTLLFAPHLENAIIIGVILSLGVFLYRTMKPRVAVLGRYPDGTLRDADLHKLETCGNVSIIRFDGSLYFANTSYFEDMVMRRSAEKPDLRYIVVDGQGINEIDATGEDVLASLTQRLAKTGVQVVFANFKRQVLRVLRDSGFYEDMGKERFFAHTELALDAIWEELGDQHDVAECPLTIACVVEGKID
ncbi:SulP family inorganic anion transporter [Sulfuriflexus mobilis]|uniref:SulP family inorganic anion transporter n=1 Tax=Sulfuriflexus mobilis TaxID=1811807 RepID=UPI0018D54AA0|nr:SulP family inorganic anion transporter [Sulfuriflexus mobilis]